MSCSGSPLATNVRDFLAVNHIVAIGSSQLRSSEMATLSAASLPPLSSHRP